MPKKVQKEINDIPRGRTCLFCGHTYMHPCDGENESCQNLLGLQKKVLKGKKIKRERVRL